MRASGPAARADVHAVHSVDDAGAVIASCCETLVELGLVEQVAPIQLAIRLLIPEGSLLLELPEVREMVGPFDADALCLPVAHPDPAIDRLCAEIQETIKREERQNAPARESSARSGNWRTTGEFPDELPLCRARDDSVSDRALVLLSGAHRRAVSSSIAHA